MATTPNARKGYGGLEYYAVVLRQKKDGYAPNSTSVVAEYNYWEYNFFRVPDLQLVPE